MLKLNAADAACLIFTFKEGLLSALAHDLKFKVLKFEMEIKISNRGSDLSAWGVAVKAVFDAASVRTVSAMKEGSEVPGTLKSQDCRDIEKNITETVLRSKQYPQILFSSEEISGDSEKLQMKGQLTLCGVTRTIIMPVKKRGSLYEAEATLDQRDYGIKPFSALMGAMKVKPEIKVRMCVPLLFTRGTKNKKD